MLDLLRKLDFAILDYIYTLVAHWAHDQFDIRSRQLGFFCMALMEASVVLSSGIFQACVDTTVFGAILVVEVYLIGDLSKLGCDNIRRFGDRFIRAIWWMCVAIDLTIPPHLLWSCAYLSALYFFAVRERPRKPKVSFARGDLVGAAS